MEYVLICYDSHYHLILYYMNSRLTQCARLIFDFYLSAVTNQIILRLYIIKYLDYP